MALRQEASPSCEAPRSLTTCCCNVLQSNASPWLCQAFPGVFWQWRPAPPLVTGSRAPPSPFLPNDLLHLEGQPTPPSPQDNVRARVWQIHMDIRAHRHAGCLPSEQQDASHRRKQCPAQVKCRPPPTAADPTRAEGCKLRHRAHFTPSKLPRAEGRRRSPPTEKVVGLAQAAPPETCRHAAHTRSNPWPTRPVHLVRIVSELHFVKTHDVRRSGMVAQGKKPSHDTTRTDGSWNSSKQLCRSYRCKRLVGS